MNDYTPTVATARVVFAEGMESHGQTREQAVAGFDRMVEDLMAEAYDIAVSELVFGEGRIADVLVSNLKTKNPYRHEIEAPVGRELRRNVDVHDMPEGEWQLNPAEAGDD